MTSTVEDSQFSEIASRWRGEWRQWSRGPATTYSGTLRLNLFGSDGISGTFVNQREGGSYNGYLEGTLSDGGRLAEGIWHTALRERGHFIFMLGPGGRSFAGTYSLNDTPADSNPANTWTGQKVTR